MTMGSFVEIAKLGVLQSTNVIHHDGYRLSCVSPARMTRIDHEWGGMSVL